eukprot:tig00000448_g918.t1
MSDDFDIPDPRYAEILGRQDYPNVHTKVVIKRDGSGWESKSLPSHNEPITAKEVISVMNAVTDPRSYTWAKIAGVDYNVSATPQGEYIYGIGTAYRGSKSAFCAAKAGHKLAMVIGRAGTDSAIQTMCMNAQDLANKVAAHDSAHPERLESEAPELDEAGLVAFELTGVAVEAGAAPAAGYDEADEPEAPAHEDLDWC